MSNVLCRKHARPSDSTFVVAAARAVCVDNWLRLDEERAAKSGKRGTVPPGGEILDYAPPTQRWAFKRAREFAAAIEAQFGRPLDEVVNQWLEQWDGDRPGTDENAGWYAAMQAMGHGVGLKDAGGIDVDLPHLESCY